MAIGSVFISSVQRDFSDVRAAARAAVENMGLHPVMAETLGARAAAPQQALLDEVRKADVFLLILGERYGDPGASGLSPTEEEFNEATRLGKRRLVLVQEVDREPPQERLLERIRAGGWENSLLYDRFAGPADASLAVVRALRALDSAPAGDPDAAATRATALAVGERSPAGMSSGVAARVAFAPVERITLLDALALEDPALEENLMGLARTTHLAPHEVGLKAQSSSDGVLITSTEPHEWLTLEFAIKNDGSVVVQASVRGGGSFGGSLIDEGRLTTAASQAGRFTQTGWDLIDTRGEIRRAAVTVAIPDSRSKGFGHVDGNTMGMGWNVPDPVVAPDPPIVAGREEIGDERFVRRVVASVRRVFADAGAVQP